MIVEAHCVFLWKQVITAVECFWIHLWSLHIILEAFCTLPRSFYTSFPKTFSWGLFKYTQQGFEVFGDNDERIKGDDGNEVKCFGGG